MNGNRMLQPDSVRLRKTTFTLWFKQDTNTVQKAEYNSVQDRKCHHSFAVSKYVQYNVGGGGGEVMTAIERAK